jgi:ABC-type multidrug transport system ATPase subunit/pSer/pThr/pTyr-binding forkhead associated (FHA) protein
MGTIQRWLIGRAADCTIVLNHAGVSGHHCCLTQTEQGFFLEDLHSVNGTFVNGTPITTRVRVSPSDHIMLGRSVPLPWPVAAPPAAAPPPLPASPPPSTEAVLAATYRAPTGTRIVTVGRGPGNDIRLDYPTVSARHARIVIALGGAQIEDLGSTNGTALGHPNHKITQAPLTEADVVFFGSLQVPARRLLSGNLTLGAQPHQQISFHSTALVLGRDPTCDQVLDAPMVSRRHARLTRVGGQLLLEDLGSANGTFLNGRRVSQPVPVRPGDRIGLAGYLLTVTDEGGLEKRNLSGNLTLEARNLTVEVPGRRLIDNVSLTIYPSELVGLMGPSGAGKTTLMNALNGYTRPTRGEVLLNGQSLYANYGQFARHLGYVPQDDIIHRDLTVRQALYYTARLRLPPDFTDEDIQNRISTVIEQLGLKGTEDTLIGSPEKKGISGGQRKRVNLAMELLTDPLVLFLDEPTSGLSSEDALLVMQLLKKLTEAGKTILITIHQPSLEVFRLLTHLALVAKDSNSPEPGKLLYFGPAYPDAIQFFNPPGAPDASAGGTAETPRVCCPRCKEVLDMPDDVLRGLDRSARAGTRSGDWQKRFAASDYHGRYVQERAGRASPELPADSVRPGGRSFYGMQWWTLVRRCLALKLRDRGNLAILAATAGTIALLLWVVFHRQLHSEEWANRQRALAQTMFILSLGALWFGMSNAVREIVGEWAIFRRERMVSLRLLPYIGSKFAVLGLLCVAQCALLLGIAYWGCGLRAPWLALFAALVLTSLVGTALGLTLSALARTPELAGTLFTWALLSMIILGGAVMPLDRMPAPVRYVCQVIPSRWAFEATLVLEAERHERGYNPATFQLLRSPNVINRPADLLSQIDMAGIHFPENDSRSGPLMATVVLAGLLLLFAGGTYTALKVRDIH